MGTVEWCKVFQTKFLKTLHTSPMPPWGVLALDGVKARVQGTPGFSMRA